MNRLKGWIYDIVLWLACMGTRNPPARHQADLPAGRLLIVRVDEIGDYMLWRNFLAEITAAQRFSRQEIHFCGNKSWKNLFDTFDNSFVAETIWLEKVQFKKSMHYRYCFLKHIYRKGYTTVINPTFSRDKRNDDAIVKSACALQRIGMASNLESVKPYEKGYDRHLYTELFDYKDKPIFEFYRNKLFSEFVTGQASSVKDTRIISLPEYKATLPENYFVVFPGSRSKARIWPVANFIAVSNYLYEQRGYTTVVCGTGSDRPYTSAFCSQYQYPFIDLTGKTSLIEMLSILKGSHCLLSVDTGSVHLAAAVGCTVFGIFNGSQYKRFAPYPSEMAPGFFPIYPDIVETDLQHPELIRLKYEFVIDIPYSTVTAEKVIAVIGNNVS